MGSAYAVEDCEIEVAATSVVESLVTCDGDEDTEAIDRYLAG
jgi:hypothetical protein